MARVNTFTRHRLKDLVMSIKERLAADSNTALKNRERSRLDVIRMVRAQIKNAEIAKRHDLSDEETIDVLVSAVKARRESLAFAKEGGREDLVQKAEQELRILEEYLPQPLSEDEVRALIAAAIRDLDATGMKDMGRVMGAVMPLVKGRADGKLVNTLVRNILQTLSG